MDIATNPHAPENQPKPAPAKSERAVTFLKPGAVKKYALTVSKAERAGKFKRVGESFVIATEAAIESAVRRMADSDRLRGLPPCDGVTFVTSHAKKKAAEKLEQLARLIIFGKVKSHPSIGVTLKD